MSLTVDELVERAFSEAQQISQAKADLIAKCRTFALENQLNEDAVLRHIFPLKAADRLNCDALSRWVQTHSDWLKNHLAKQALLERLLEKFEITEEERRLLGL